VVIWPRHSLVGLHGNQVSAETHPLRLMGFCDLFFRLAFSHRPHDSFVASL